MKSKLGRIIKEISNSGDSSDVPEDIRNELYCDIVSYTPEKIAFHFSEWKLESLGIKVVYFRNGKRTSSRSWEYFEKLSSMLNHWNAVLGDKIDLYEYFHLHFQRVGKGENLYPSQLVMEYSNEIVLGKGSMNPSLIEFVETTVHDYEKSYLATLKELSNQRQVSELDILQEESDFLHSCPNALSEFPYWFVKKYITIYREKLKGK